MTESGYRIVLTLIVTVGFGLFDEWHQTFVPGRYGSLTDAGFNVIGAVMGLLVYRSWFSLREYNL
jgi:VanZ family protein